MSGTLKQLKAKIRYEKASITRALTFIQNIPENTTSEQIQSRLTRLETAWKDFLGFSRELYAYDDDEDYVDPENEILEYEEKFLMAQGIFWENLKALSPEEPKVEPQNEIISQLIAQNGQLMQNANLQSNALLQRLESSSNHRAEDHDLPKIRIEPFTGNYKDWPEFKDLFVSSVDSKSNLPNVKKFQYLKSLLKGEAANLIKHIQINESSYTTAWERLKERFDRPKHIVNSYIETFMTLSTVKDENPFALRKISDISNEVIRGLDAISHAERDPWLIHILLNKIDTESRRKWIERSREDNKPTISTFLKFLDQRCEELELGKKSYNKSGTKQYSSTTLVAMDNNQSCDGCGSTDHFIYKCPQLTSLTVDQRRSFIREKLLCFNCLRKGHNAQNCKSKNTCRNCSRKHHTLLHATHATSAQQSNLSVLNESSDDAASVAELDQALAMNTVVAQSSADAFVHTNVNHILPTALVNVYNHENKAITCRALLDTASELSYITEDCIKLLGLPRKASRIALSGISSVKAETTRGHSFLHIKSRTSDNAIDAKMHILGRITSSLPRSKITDYDRETLSTVKEELADPTFYRSSPIDILLGADCVWDVFTLNKLRDAMGNVMAVSTLFGWVVTSVFSSSVNEISPTLVTLVDIDQSLKAFWEIEECTTFRKEEDESLLVEQHFKDTHHRHSDGKYVVELPFKEDNINFADTFKGALARFNVTERRLSRNPTLKAEYTKFMQDYHNLKHMREISSDEIEVEDKRVFYLPHHPVVTTKLRVVFDGSFKDTAGLSLNDKLHIGPSIQRNLFGVCLRFRLHAFVFSADIVKMFRQIWVAEHHRNFQRIIWRENPDEPLKHFQLCTVTYGTASAPFLSVRVLEQLATDYKESHPNASKSLLQDFYVDDVLTGASSEQELVKNRNELVDLLSQAKLELSKWVSNSSLLTAAAQHEPSFLKKDDATKVLGIHWYSEEDVIGYKICLGESLHATKRSVLSDVARIFDPLGLVSPVVIKFKILFQELWLLNLDWDAPLPPNLASMWIKYRNDLHNLEHLKLPRFVPNNETEIHLNAFSDASIKAYSAVVYCTWKDENGNAHTSLIASKTRVAPLKQISLPRLELCGALLLTRLMKSVISSLPHQQIHVNAWCDSTVVLSWLSIQPIKLKTFVANRTSEILDTLPRHVWKHVIGKENPADCASRGLMADQLLSYDLWWTGPSSFLKTQHLDKPSPQARHDLQNNPYVEAEMKSRTNALVTTPDVMVHPLEPILQDSSSWYKFVRVTAYVHRFINLRTRGIRNPAKYLTYDEIAQAKRTCLKMAQDCFSMEKSCLLRGTPLNKNSKLLKLSPYIDADGLLRVGGRISNSELSTEVQHPIIIPKNHRVASLILNEEHAANLHPGVSSLFVIIRQKYWIIGARNLIRQLTHKCLKCFRQVQHTTQQRMADLPAVRVRQAFPFQNTGCDYAGPFVLKIHNTRNSKTSKGYICLFVCMVTSALHLELVTDLSTECFLAALRRFMARRGKCSSIYSDNGKNFVGAQRQLNELYQQLQSERHHEIITETLAREGIKWTFIPPYSPHWGGIWESGVRSVKLHLRRIIGNSILTFEQMHTLLAQIEAVVNSRPLGAAPDTDTHYLSPSHFLIGRPTTMVPEGDLTELPINRLSYWQNVQCMYQGFWKRWSKEYLTSLQQRPKWTNIQPNIQVDDLVLVKEDRLPPATWITGRVIETFPGNDGLTRAVKLKTSQGTMTRSIVKLVKLPVC